MKPQRSKNWRLLVTLGLLCQTICGPVGHGINKSSNDECLNVILRINFDGLG